MIYTQLFPSGIEQFIIGGLLVGLGISFIYITTGLVAGASTFFTSTISYFSKLSFFKKTEFISTRDWRLFLALGLILGGAIYTLVFNNGNNPITEIEMWRIILGGFLIGIGTRVANGCPSGHGICGLAEFNKTSFFAVVTFLSVAIAVASLIKFLGVVS